VSVFVVAVSLALAARATSRDVPLERRLETALARFFPAPAGKLIATEMLTMFSSWAGLRAVFSPTHPSAESYSNDNPLGIIGLILLVGAIPDILLHHLFIPAHLRLLALSLDIVELYACAWVLGTYGLMVLRPHQLSRSRIALNCGLLGRIELRPDQIRSAVEIEPTKRKLLRRRNPGAGFLTAPGVRVIELNLTQPVRLDKLLSVRGRDISRLFVSSDRPSEFCARVRALQTAAAG
ncbi:MAG: hypothetical protein M3Y21_10295, partial [Candidatus Eremiobacteraeota bacterium]|nr:hypothetical protein [Candidatus Eremiobacteraeota bacterium]